jgi:hypothetical protein
LYSLAAGLEEGSDEQDAEHQVNAAQREIAGSEAML